MHADAPVNPWATNGPVAHRGGRVVVARERAPLARALPYRRAAGEGPNTQGCAVSVRRSGWSVVLGDRGLGDTLLALGLVRALADGTGHMDLHYTGPLPELMRRCRPRMRTNPGAGPHVVRSRIAGRGFAAVPEEPPAWLDVLDAQQVEVHAALPMRYYLAAEHELGVRLPADSMPLPRFRTDERAQPHHVIFISATSWPDRKDYGICGFEQIAQLMESIQAAPWRFTLITGNDAAPAGSEFFEVLAGPDLSDCIDMFGSAELVIGNDTGLTHLAALTERADGTGPQVIGLYGRHAHNKWTTGSTRHHAVATPFSQMLAMADRCPVRDQLDEAVWSSASHLDAITPELIAGFACDVAGW